MLKNFLILTIAMIAMVSARKVPTLFYWPIRLIPVNTPIQVVSGGIAPATSVQVVNMTVPGPMLPAKKNCTIGDIFRENCNICTCYSTGPSCSNIDCNSLPDKVKKGNAVADNALPTLPVLDKDAVVGQVYKYQTGYCVAAALNKIECIR